MNVVRNKKGLTLVEVMIALVVLLLVSLALMQTALVSIDVNMRNSLRDEAVRVAETRVNEARNLPWTDTNDKLLSDTDDSIADDNFSFSGGNDWKECTCREGEGCQAAVGLDHYDNGPYPVKVDRTVRNMTVSFGTRRVVNTLDATNREVRIIVRAVYKDKCYSQVSSTIVRRQGT